MNGIAQTQGQWVNYRVWLNQELDRRREKNPSYSLRAFAKAVGLSHSSLSQIISGKRPLTRKATLKLADRLCLAPELVDSLVRSAENQLSVLSPSSSDEAYLLLEAEKFRAISDWYHYAILCLLELPGSSSRPMEWFAGRLSIPKRECRAAFERLQKLGLLTRKKGRFYPTPERLTTTSDISSPALRKFQKQNLKKAEESLERDPVELRELSSITMIIDPALLPEAKKEIKKFRRALSRLLERGNKKRVYTLAVQLFPVDHGDFNERS